MVLKAPKFTESSVYQTHAAYKVYRSALGSSRCRRSRDGSFFDSKRLWYSPLKDFSILIEQERCGPSCELKKDAAKLSEDVVGTSYSATADQLWILPKERLCNKARLHALQEKFFGLKWNERQQSLPSLANVWGQHFRLCRLQWETSFCRNDSRREFLVGPRTKPW